MYTRESLDDALRVYLSKEAIKSAGRPTSCTMAAEQIFMKELPETPHTKVIREALLDLHTDAMFHFQD